ncbi:type II toxin-antitoxin system VapC family toxin [Cupriavidus sp. D384]|uniref:type II toxin-antitoxin system VapC family toxin n=1 Tax=Cupriavidus sp. D384 TaxID=1538095 RepID=UPI000836340D|nr:type II toxin-antitoxin system VapC family toxin [Cupriavidus sp. D384]
MPTYMLDTNICIYLMKQQPPQVAERMANCFEGEVVLSAITLAELEYGVSVSSEPEAARRALDALVSRLPVMPYTASAAHAYGPIRAATRQRKADALDKLIASHARSIGAIVVTSNVRDFEAYPGIQIEDWTKPAVIGN